MGVLLLGGLLLSLGLTRALGQGAPDGYLSRVGPTPLRLIVPPPVPKPAPPAPAVVAVPETNAPAPQVAAAPPPPPTVVDPREFIGPPLPPVSDEPAPRGPEHSLYPEVLPAESAAVALAGITNQTAITAQMLVRFFRHPAPGAAVAPGAVVPTSPPAGSPGVGETSIWLPVQFVPPQPASSQPSSATYNLTPK